MRVQCVSHGPFAMRGDSDQFTVCVCVCVCVCEQECSSNNRTQRDQRTQRDKSVWRDHSNAAPKGIIGPGYHSTQGITIQFLRVRQDL